MHCVEEHFHLLELELDRIMKQELDPRDKLKQIFLGYIRFGLNNQSHYEIMFLIKDEGSQRIISIKVQTKPMKNLRKCSFSMWKKHKYSSDMVSFFIVTWLCFTLLSSC